VGARPLAVLASALFLAGCWTGAPFYSLEELRAPVSPGLYRTIGTDSPSERDSYRVSIRRDGYTSFARIDGGDTAVAGFVPLPGSDTHFVAWFEEGGARGDDRSIRAYGLLQRRGLEFLVSFPMCSETRALAEAVGAVFVPDPKVPLCRFPDRASLEAGLKRAAAEGPLEQLRLVPVQEATRD
jgi:hypothetical protein